MGKDVGTADQAATNAVENNWTSGFGFPVHQDAISESLKGELTTKELKILQESQVFADKPEFQTSINSFRHAMRDADTKQEVEAARALANDFIRNQFDRALRANTKKEALTQFGLALHVLQDSTSPEHAGFREWSKDYSFINQVNHGRKERKNPGKGSELYKATKQAWQWFKDKKLPKGNLFIFGSDVEN